MPTFGRPIGVLTGFFRGPPLVAHALLVAVVVALATPLVADRVSSRGWALLIVGGLVALYFFLALVWASRHVLFARHPGRSDPSDRS